ncbi:MAG: hypothetical protein N0E59_02335 [Candidatus Thiodiazotropha taylori]|nr:hypothetical protein [Candidatus Thiodiazotropha taylori]MCW4281922.1 hypothetical protein [Candidatus Thiodiazotropha taylori]
MKIIPLILAVVLLPSVLQAEPANRLSTPYGQEYTYGYDFMHAMSVDATTLPDWFLLFRKCEVGTIVSERNHYLLASESGSYLTPDCKLKLHDLMMDKIWEFHVFYDFEIDPDGLCKVSPVDKRLNEVLPHVSLKIAVETSDRIRLCKIKIRPRIGVRNY